VAPWTDTAALQSGDIDERRFDEIVDPKKMDLRPTPWLRNLDSNQG
jgi:hypothetical protein